MSSDTSAIEHVCASWETAVFSEPVSRSAACRSAVLLPGADAEPRFCFVSVGSPIESVMGSGSDVKDRSGVPITLSELVNRLVDGEVATVLAPRTAIASASSKIELPAAFLSRRQEIRRDNVVARFLLRQIGLEEVSSHRGAPSQLYRSIAQRWSHDLSLCIDPAMMLTLGADRQRYVDVNYTERATDRLPRALGRLHDLGIRSYPRLVIV